MAARALTAAAAVALCLACAATAAAAPITFGIGRHPDVAVDENGVAHVVWDSQVDGSDPINYCQILPKGTTCTNQRSLPAPLEAIGRVTHVFAPGGGRILIASTRCCGTGEGTNVLESNNNGSTFTAPRLVGNYERPSEIAFGPGETLLSASFSQVQLSPLSGPPATTRAELDPGFNVPTDSAIGTYKGTTPVFVHSDGDDMTYHVGTPGGNLNAAAAWTGPTRLPEGGEVEMESNPRGLVIIREAGSPGKRVWATQVFDGAGGFSGLNPITEAGDPIRTGIGGSPFKGGSFHAAWVDNRKDQLKWARSPQGFNWSEASVVLSGDQTDDIYRIRIAGAPDGRAFAVWDPNGPSGSARGMWLPAKGSGPPISAVKVAQYEWSFNVSFPCVSAGGKLNMSIGTKSTGSLPKNKSVNITKIQFRRGKQTMTDTKPPWKASFPDTQSPVGALRAFISYKYLAGNKKGSVAVLKGSAAVCP